VAVIGELLGGSDTVVVVLVVDAMLGAVGVVDVVGVDDPEGAVVVGLVDAAGGFTGAGRVTGFFRRDAAAAIATGACRRRRCRGTAPRRRAFR
jgi:hypothetical protein